MSLHSEGGRDGESVGVGVGVGEADGVVAMGGLGAEDPSAGRPPPLHEVTRARQASATGRLLLMSWHARRK
ncbi:hypothetical protein Skr01_63570 [Sphaerisporangium krabiense]|nr:hypothetical protein Skr01_63570 [Sphaerisporangium krabiense]